MVWNRNPDRCRALVREGAVIIPSLSNLTQNAETIITVLRDGPVTQKVVSELGNLNGSCLMPMGTMGIAEIRRLAQQVQDQNGTCLEAPVLGSKPQAANGTLLVMAGGTKELFDQQRPLLDHLSQQPMLVGAIGSGAATAAAATLGRSFSMGVTMARKVRGTAKSSPGTAATVLWA